MAGANKSGCVVGVLLALFLCSALINVILSLVLAAGGESPTAITRPTPYAQRLVMGSADASERIAVIPLSGMISFSVSGRMGQSMVEDLRFALEQALRDDAVKAIVLDINSGGGEVTASDEIYHLIKSAREKKPVVASMTAVGASGAYYAACGASHIMAYDTTFTGSIGVIIQTLNYRELFGKIGLESMVFKSGKFKDFLNGARELTEEEREYVQGMVMQTYGQFVSIVARERKLDEAELRAGVADGRILSGIDALAAKLVDSTGRLDDAFAKAKELSGATDAAVVRYMPPVGLGRLLEALSESKVDPKVEINVAGLPGAAESYKLEPGCLYYLPLQFLP